MKTSAKNKKTAKGKPAEKSGAPRQRRLRSKVGFFRWLKKSLLGKSQGESLDLLDQWIIKKRPMSLFF